MTTGYFDSGVCITCGEEKPFDELDAGHFMKATHRKIDFEPDNVAAQCRRCNRFQDGMQYEFGKKLEGRLGEVRVNWLRAQKGTNKRSIDDYLQIEEAYKKAEESLARNQEDYDRY